MIGNVKGWTIAMVVLTAEAGAVAYTLSFDATSPMTAIASAPGALDKLALPIDPRTIVATDQPGDAGPAYRKAAADYLAEPSLYENFARDKDRSAIPKLIGVQSIVPATRLQGGAIFAETPEKVVDYGDSNVIVALRSVGLAAVTSGLLNEKKDPARAKQLYEAAFSLGVRLFDERLSYREMTAGIELMSTAGAALADLHRKAGRADEQAKIVKFTNAQLDYATKVLQPKFDAIYTMSEAKIGEHNGDVFAFARDSKERMWRVEAILKLGRMKFNVGNPGSPGDQRNAARLSTRFAEVDTDPVIRRAATLARDLTVDQFRTIH